MLFTAITAVASFVVWAVHYLIVGFSSLPVLLKTSDYSLIIALTLITFYISAFLLRTRMKYVGAAYVGIGFVKLIVVGSWFFAYISDVSSQTKIYVLQFFAVYFLFQLLEVAVLGKTLNTLKIDKP